MKVIVCGPAFVTNYDLVKQAITDSPWGDKVETVVCTYRPDGVDLLGARWADSTGVRVRRFYGKPDEHGQDGYRIRNADMAAFADAAVVVWDGRCGRTGPVRQAVVDAGKPVHDVVIDRAAGTAVTDRSRLIRTVITDMTDDIAKLVLADWLADHGEPLPERAARSLVGYRWVKVKKGWDLTAGGRDDPARHFVATAYVSRRTWYWGVTVGRAGGWLPERQQQGQGRSLDEVTRAANRLLIEFPGWTTHAENHLRAWTAGEASR